MLVVVMMMVTMKLYDDDDFSHVDEGPFVHVNLGRRNCYILTEMDERNVL